MDNEQNEPQRKIRKIEKLYVIWNFEEKKKLIDRRIELDHLFTNKNSNTNEAWRTVAQSGKLGADKIFKNYKTQWAAILKKYKSFFEVHTGEGAGDDAPENKEEKRNWPFFDIIHQYASNKDNYHPPYLISSTDGEHINKHYIVEDSESSFSSLFSGESSSTQIPPNIPTPSTSQSTSRKKLTGLSEFEKHVVKRDKKICKQISGSMAVFGQVVQQEHPNIDVNSLLISSESESD